MKNLKKIGSLALASVMLMGLFAGCTKKREVRLNEDGTSAIKNTTAVVAYNSVGYGHDWLIKCAEERSSDILFF